METLTRFPLLRTPALALLLQHYNPVSLQFLEQVGHFDSAHSSIITFITSFGSGTLHGLLDGFRSQDSERHRHAGLAASAQT